MGYNGSMSNEPRNGCAFGIDPISLDPVPTPAQVVKDAAHLAGMAIHHIDGNPRNNDLENLQVVPLDRRS